MDGYALGLPGLSPLTRGNRGRVASWICLTGPIPAHAGQPGLQPLRQTLPGAYPRSRGATRARFSLRQSSWGLSPLTRGNRPSTACPLAGMGLSPLTRGNRQHSSKSIASLGPIPAHAGQPAPTGTSRRATRAYPRSRGATKWSGWLLSSSAGLSPLTRGNRRGAVGRVLPFGPIPAHAGQPACRIKSYSQTWAYPRSRGATEQSRALSIAAEGLSPLTRGNRNTSPKTAASQGPIPAHAGQPQWHRKTTLAARAYPRSRGATQRLLAPPERQRGLSPLTRGNLAPQRHSWWCGGPIPAHAGQPSNWPSWSPATTAYPRSRGATDWPLWAEAGAAGLSPLTRGNLTLFAPGQILGGPIPAHAGQPPEHPPILGTRGAYPRSRGATALDCSDGDAPMGLSPLTRGNLVRSMRDAVMTGPIPAHAGQPAPATKRAWPLWAYPRSRGATAIPRTLIWVDEGLSPLTRGNLGCDAQRFEGFGPIPAHAGQPLQGAPIGHPCTAYPRSRGATDIGKRDGCAIWGLSPLTRGNPHRRSHAHAAVGPIPAHAGQPSTTLPVLVLSTAYPRSRGATFLAVLVADSYQGLSPLTRGNPAVDSITKMPVGPIPAHAGQPPPASPIDREARAYPRSRGATFVLRGLVHAAQGLSPLTRGNLFFSVIKTTRTGPIPAHAGQPRNGHKLPWSIRAYPRSRGATDGQGGVTPPHRGLSPLTRGNPRSCSTLHPHLRPIPAHAGQPMAVDLRLRFARAYPRSRGATDTGQCNPSLELGLSPLTRGNPLRCSSISALPGPIPAHAGQPGPFTLGAILWRAYPRSRGATSIAATASICGTGLSPLTRGNLRAIRPLSWFVRPIPAHAGQPGAAGCQWCAARAYPRSRGATSTPKAVGWNERGLSPLTRGNRALSFLDCARFRPIPAHAGQPLLPGATA